MIAEGLLRPDEANRSAFEAFDENGRKNGDFLPEKEKCSEINYSSEETKRVLQTYEGRMRKFCKYWLLL
jgi:hypothetical protein